MNKPRLIHFKKIGNPSEGYISIFQNGSDMPFEIKRSFWTYYTPEEVIRGRHAHYDTEMILIAAAGKIIVNTEFPGQPSETVVLEKPDYGLYIPKLCWHTMQYSHNAVQLVLASSEYDEKDYIRNYEDFKNIKP
jgi:dTDP-4-dehydrorhamnose 3,5-epimerase-like enzyme